LFRLPCKFLEPNSNCIWNNNLGKRYGIEAIAQTYEDPFGVAKIDINMDDIVEDTRREVEVLLAAWQTQGKGDGGIFRPRGAEKSDSSSDYYGREQSISEESRQRSQVKLMVSDLSEETYQDDESANRGRLRMKRTPSGVSPGNAGVGSSTYFDV